MLVIPGISGYPSWKAVAFDGDNFTGGNSQTWTVAEADVRANRYIMLTPTTMLWVCNVFNSTVGGTPDPKLLIALPNGKAGPAGTTQTSAITTTDNNTFDIGVGVVMPGETVISLFLKDFTNWAASTNLSDAAFMFTFEVEDA